MSEPLTDLPDETPEPEPDETPEPEPDETPEPEPDETPEAPQTTDPPGAVTPELMEKRVKASERALGTYSKKISEIWDEDGLHLIPCPLCTFSVAPGFVDERDAGRFPEDVVKPALTFLGRTPSADYEDDPDHVRCVRCDGRGEVKTGSQVPQWERLPCGMCNGSGMTPPPSLGPGQPAPAPLAVVPDNGQPPDAQFRDADDWGEPTLLPDGRANPNFGKMPQFKVPVEPWGVTAGLSAQDAVTSAP